MKTNYGIYSKDHSRIWSKILSNLFKYILQHKCPHYASKIKHSMGIYSNLSYIMQNWVLLIHVSV